MCFALCAAVVEIVNVTCVVVGLCVLCMYVMFRCSTLSGFVMFLYVCVVTGYFVVCFVVVCFV